MATGYLLDPFQIWLEQSPLARHLSMEPVYRAIPHNTDTSNYRSFIRCVLGKHDVKMYRAVERRLIKNKAIIHDIVHRGYRQLEIDHDRLSPGIKEEERSLLRQIALLELVLIQSPSTSSTRPGTEALLLGKMLEQWRQKHTQEAEWNYWTELFNTVPAEGVRYELDNLRCYLRLLRMVMSGSERRRNLEQKVASTQQLDSQEARWFTLGEDEHEEPKQGLKRTFQESDEESEEARIQRKKRRRLAARRIVSG